MYCCQRCNTKFDKESDMISHINEAKRKVPCDFYCMKCGTKLSSRYAYVRHTKGNNCKIKQYSNNELNTMNDLHSNILNIEKGNSNRLTNNSNNVSVNGNTQMTNIYQPISIFIQAPELTGKINRSFVSQYGISPHDSEYRDIDFKSLKNSWIVDTLTDYFEKHEDVPHTEETLGKLIISMALHMYSNPNTPENVNIIDKDPNSKYNQVYSGKEFVQDFLTKNMRNKKIMQRILLIIFECINKGVLELRVTTFCMTILIPHIMKHYFSELYHDAFQNIWRKNMELYERIKKENKYIPNYRCKEKLDFKQQLEEYNTMHELINRTLKELELSTIDPDVEAPKYQISK